MCFFNFKYFVTGLLTSNYECWRKRQKLIHTTFYKTDITNLLKFDKKGWKEVNRKLLMKSFEDLS